MPRSRIADEARSACHQHLAAQNSSISRTGLRIYFARLLTSRYRYSLPW
jgi:hypothetical protein